MSDVTRRHSFGGFGMPKGDYVPASDYDACVQKLSAKCEELETHGRALDQCRALLKQECDDVIPLRTRCAALRAELARTKELLCEFLTEADQVAWFDEPEDKQFERALSWVKSFHALRAEVERLAEELQRTNGTASLAMQHRDAAETKIERLRAVLVMMYDKWEDGTPCHDEHDIFVGNAFQLTQAEEDSVLALIPADRAALAADVDDCPHGPGCGHSPPD